MRYGRPSVPISYAMFGFADCEKGIIQAGVSFQPCFISLRYQGDSAMILPMVDMVSKQFTTKCSAHAEGPLPTTWAIQASLSLSFLDH